MNTKCLILKKGLFIKKLMNTIPLIFWFQTAFTTILHQKKQGKTFNNFLIKKIISNKQIHKG